MPLGSITSSLPCVDDCQLGSHSSGTCFKLLLLTYGIPRRRMRNSLTIPSGPRLPRSLRGLVLRMCAALGQWRSASWESGESKSKSLTREVLTAMARLSNPGESCTGQPERFVRCRPFGSGQCEMRKPTYRKASDRSDVLRVVRARSREAWTHRR